MFDAFFFLSFFLRFLDTTGMFYCFSPHGSIEFCDNKKYKILMNNARCAA